MALTDNCIAYYKLDESSGDAADATGNTNTLTNNNSTAYGTGKINNGVDFERGSSNYLSRADDTDFDFSTACTFNFWMKHETLANDEEQQYINKYGAAGNRPYRFFIVTVAGVQTITFQSSADGTASTVSAWVSGVDFTALSTGTFYMISLVYEGGSTQATLLIDASSKGAKTATASLFNGTASLGVGCGDVSTTPGDFVDGVMDELGFWTRALSGAEITSLYNGGSGIQYPFAAGGPTTLESWNTVNKGTIETLNTTALANIESWNSVA